MAFISNVIYVDGRRRCSTGRNGCGFYGSSEKQGYCSKCWKPTLAAPLPVSEKCFKCSKRIGLLGFTCRCNERFCGLHRYPEGHECPVDYKADGLKRLKNENPVQHVGSKIKKI